MLASGFDITTIPKLTSVLDEGLAIVGEDRLGCLHVNDSQVALGSNVDRHATLPDGELGERGLSAFLSEPRFEGLPAILETVADAEQVEIARRLRKKGLAARRRAAKKD
jgi:deoxyribonuclease-4